MWTWSPKVGVTPQIYTRIYSWKSGGGGVYLAMEGAHPPPPVAVSTVKRGSSAALIFTSLFLKHVLISFFPLNNCSQRQPPPKNEKIVMANQMGMIIPINVWDRFWKLLLIQIVLPKKWGYILHPPPYSPPPISNVFLLPW